MSFARILILKIKNASRGEVYDLWDQNKEMFDENTSKTFLSFLALESDLSLAKRYFNQISETFENKKWSYDLPTYALVIRLNCLIGEYSIALGELFKMETDGLEVKTRMIRPLFEMLPSSNPEILIGLFRRYRKIMKAYDYYHFLLKLSKYIDCQPNQSSKTFQEYPDLCNFIKKETILTQGMVLETVRHVFQEWNRRQEILPKSLLDLVIKWFPEYHLIRINVEALRNGQCFYCNNFLVPKFLSNDERTSLVDQLLKAYPSIQMLNKFKNWLMLERRYERPTFIIDAGNVGYYQKAGFSYWQIDRMVNLLVKKYSSYFQYYFGTKELPQILIVIHQRHLKFKPEKINLPNRPSKSLSADQKEKMAQNADKYISKWKKNGYIYSTPAGSNDDLFWILASFLINKSITITNDMMRDHHSNRFDSNLFYRWRERHVANYNVKETEYGNVMEVNMPLPYSIGFQEINRDNSLVTGWHIPVFKLKKELEDELESDPSSFPDPKYFPDPVKNHVELITDPSEITWYCLSKTI